MLKEGGIDTPMQVYYSKKKQGKKIMEDEEELRQKEKGGTSHS